MNQRLKRAAGIVVKKCLGVKRQEKALIVIDRSCRAIGYALWEAMSEITEPILVEIAPRKIHGEEPPGMVAQLLKKCDVFILPTSHSLTHTHARIAANKSGARGATMPGITVGMMTRTLNADYGQIARLTKKIAARLTKARRATIVTGAGSRLELKIKDRPGHPDTGIVHKPGQFSNLPAGEAYSAPLENGSNGVIVIDGSFAPLGALKKKVVVKVENGYIVDIQGNRTLKGIFNAYGKKERLLCELGIGTNHKATISGNVLEDEKVLGSIHVAFGNNLAFGGKNDAKIHLDGVTTKPTLWLDDTLLIEEGKFINK